MVCFYFMSMKPLIEIISDHYLLTAWSRVLIEKQTGCPLVKKHPAFYGTRRFITAITSARHLPLSWASSIQSILTHTTSWKSFLILSSNLSLGLPCGLFPSDFHHQNSEYASPIPIHATYPTHLIILDFITRKILSEQHISLSSSLCIYLYSPVYKVNQSKCIFYCTAWPANGATVKLSPNRSS